MVLVWADGSFQCGWLVKYEEVLCCVQHKSVRGTTTSYTSPQHLKHSPRTETDKYYPSAPGPHPAQPDAPSTAPSSQTPPLPTSAAHQAAHTPATTHTRRPPLHHPAPTPLSWYTAQQPATETPSPAIQPIRDHPTQDEAALSPPTSHSGSRSHLHPHPPLPQTPSSTRHHYSHPHSFHRQHWG
jgi:hypothetical protein